MKILDGHIEITPNVRFGKPRIAGRRITVSDVAIWHEQQGMSVADIERECQLPRADIHAALAYYFDHREDIDREIREGGEFAERMRQKSPSPLQQRLNELRAADDNDSTVHG